MSSLKLSFIYDKPLTEKSKTEISQLMVFVADYKGERDRPFEYNHFQLENTDEQVKACFFINHLYRTTEDLGRIFTRIQVPLMGELISFKLLNTHFKPFAIKFKEKALSGKYRYTAQDLKDKKARIELEYEFDDAEIVPYLGRCKPHPWETWVEHIEQYDEDTKQRVFTGIVADLTAQDCLDIVDNVKMKTIDKIADYIPGDFREWFSMRLANQTNEEKRSLMSYIRTRASSITELTLLTKSRTDA